jgi:hypothetical protein
MSAFRFLSATLLSALGAFSLVTASGCGTDVIGIEACRDIENARCEASLPCGVVTDVAACKRFYRDQCLHGLSAPLPAGASVAQCVSVIRAAGRCAADDPEIALSACNENETVTEPAPGLTGACDVVRLPERAAECAFLAPDLEVPDEGAGGAGGTPAVDEEEPDASAGVGGQAVNR